MCKAFTSTEFTCVGGAGSSDPARAGLKARPHMDNSSDLRRHDARPPAGRVRSVVVPIVVAMTLLIAFDASPWPWTTDRIWFTPGPGTVDMLQLFESPDEWPHARQAMDVFEFYQGHLLTQVSPGEGPNSYQAFVRADAFRKLLRWGKRIAVEMAAVKEFYCTPDSSGMQESIARTIEALRNVQAAGGRVTYVAMDEPFIGGLSRRCGGPAFEPTADRLATYIPAVRQAFPNVRLGLIEPYPFFSPDQIAQMLRLLHDRQVGVDFLHIDGQRPPIPTDRDEFASGLLELSALAADYHIPFGVILFGDNGDADALYAADALRNATELKHVFRSWEVMPDHVIIQSWALSRTGLFITPSNLPETAPNTHTAIINQIVQILHTLKVPRG
jgi:hypothetical protein